MNRIAYHSYLIYFSILLVSITFNCELISQITLPVKYGTNTDTSINIDRVAWRYFPEASAIYYVSDDQLAANIQAGIGINIPLSDDLATRMSGVIGISNLSTNQSQPYSTFGVSLAWNPIQTHRNSKFTALFTTSYGAYGADVKTTLQVVVGGDVRYILLRGNDRYFSTFDAVCKVGYGRDFKYNYNQGFVNLGIAIGDFASITFDLLSLFVEQTPIIHAGRLQ